jgi:hypothetical protein
MAKRISVSTDDVTYYTLPGASGEKRTEMATVDDTIFGQEFQSESPSIGMWEVSGAAYFKGVAGYSTKLNLGGTPVATTGEAFTLVSGKTYQITDAARRIIALASTLTVYDNAVDQTAEVVSVDYLNGTVTFDSGYTVNGPVTADYSYVPTTALGKGRSFNLNQTMAEIDTTDYETALANGGWRTHIPGLKTVGLEVGNVHDVATDFIADLAARNLIYVEVSPDDSIGDADQTMFRGFFKYLQQGQQGNVGALEEETINLNLFVPEGSLIETPFSWYYGASTALSQAVRICLDAWQNGTNVYVEYSPDGTAGKKGQAVVTEASLQNTFEGQNEFSFTFKGTGAQSDI